MSTIYATRLGFCYQDKMACLYFLRELRSGAIRELYTDYPIPNSQHSLDILLKTGADDAVKEKVYEVKTGQQFKKDKGTHKGRSSEIRDVILTFVEYSGISPTFEGFICFSNGSEAGLTNYKSPADMLKARVRLDDSGRTAARDLMTILKIGALNTQRDTHKFFRRVIFEESPYSNNQTWSTLDEHIRSEITGIAQALGIDHHVEELPNDYLACKLLHTIQKLTGSGDDATRELLAAVMDFMLLRKLLESHSVAGTPGQLRQDAEQYVKAEMISKFKVESLLPEENASAADLTASDEGVGGTIGE